ncbi:hypothetical protein [Sphingomonas sp.]|uniref:hypothetical protein n=1 Tax=Sphingomonas sp. TaxID=28214 RepID=UPI0035B01B0F
MGKSSKPTIGYRHFMYLYMGESIGPNDYLAGIKVGGQPVFEGERPGSGTLAINLPELFGGDKKEGGLVGTLQIRMGEQSQLPDPYLQQQVPGPWPAARGLCTTLYRGMVGAMNPYLKLWAKRWGRFVQGWSTPVWQPQLARIGRGMNAAHIHYQCLTDTVWGVGLDPALVDEDSFLRAAQRLYDEQFGLCLGWRRGDSIGSFLQQVNNHVGGLWAFDPMLGKFVYRLFRPDYDAATLPLLDETSVTALESWQTPLLDGSVNEVTVLGRDCVTNLEIAATFQNMANVQAQGRVVADRRTLPGLWNRNLCERVAARETAAASSLLQRIKLTVDRRWWGVKRGDVLALSWRRKGVQRMPVRVLEVDEGTRTDGALALVLLQDIDGMAATTYLRPVIAPWTPPDTRPLPLPAQRLIEATYRDLAGRLRPADLALVEDDAGFVVALGARPNGPAYGYTLLTRTAGGMFAEVGSGDFSATATLAGALGLTETVATLADLRDLDLVAVGSEALIDEELVRIDAVDAIAGTLTLARGCVDTVPAPHAEGTRVWFTESYVGADPTEHLAGETIEAKLLTRTQEGTLDASLAPVAQVRLDSRQARPYPPGRLRINGSAAPPTSYARLSIAWAYRDRVLQGDRLIEHEAGGIGPEPDTTTSVRVLHAVSGAVLHETAGIVGTSHSVDVLLASDATVRVEVRSQRGALASRQAHIRLIQSECGEKLANADFDVQTAWTLGAGWSIAGGGANKVAGTASDLAQPFAFVDGALYRVEVVLSQVSAGSVRIVLAGAVPMQGDVRTASGSFVEPFTANAHTALRVAADAAFAGRIERVSLRRLA